MRNVTADFGKYELEEIGEEFRSTANITEKSYILPKTVGGTKVLKIHEFSLFLSNFSLLEWEYI